MTDKYSSCIKWLCTKVVAGTNVKQMYSVFMSMLLQSPENPLQQTVAYVWLDMAEIGKQDKALHSFSRPPSSSPPPMAE